MPKGAISTLWHWQIKISKIGIPIVSERFFVLFLERQTMWSIQTCFLFFSQICEKIETS